MKRALPILLAITATAFASTLLRTDDDGRTSVGSYSSSHAASGLTVYCDPQEQTSNAKPLLLNNQSDVFWVEPSGEINGLGGFDITGNLKLDRTIITTAGDTTINKNLGQCILETGNDSVTVTNSRATTSSLILYSIESNGEQTRCKGIEKSNGEFRFWFDGTPSSDVKITFLVLN